MASLAAGAQLGPYVVIGPLGEGGMGEVYRARDTRLDRDVAIKILPPLVAQDADRRARFEREAKAVAALSHPNILAIHDVGVHEGTTYAVTELLEGETLRQRLEAGSTTPRKAVEIGIQIAIGLAAAHDKQIVHRDLKPDNLFITRDGRVKILDFGLAAQRTGADAPTMAGGTEPGVILGTVGYMAPEQVRGARIDHRTDIFALGAVLFELLTGRRAFQRDTAAETMTAILKEDVPELSASGRPVPQPLDRIVRRCLEKHPDERMQSARDIAIALDAVSGSEASGVAVSVPPPARMNWLRVAAAVALLAAGVAGGWGLATMRAPRTASAEPPRYRQLTFQRGEIRAARFTPDGQSVVYSASWDGAPVQVYTIRLDRPRATAPPLIDAALLAVSRSGDMAIATRPERRSLFIEPGTLAHVPLSGGAPREVLENVTSASFAPDGAVAIVRADGGRTRLEFPIGTVLHETAAWISSPRFSASGDRIAFVEHPLHDDDRGWPSVVDVATRTRRNLTPEITSISGLAWTPSGDEVCFAAIRDIRCVALETQAVRVVLRGAPRLVLHDIGADGRMLASAYAIRGAMAGGEIGGREVDLSWQDVAFPVAFTADGRRLLFGTIDYGVQIRDVDGGRPVRLAEGIPTGFSPDDRFVLAMHPAQPTRITVVPTGPGTTRTLPRGTVDAHTGAVWMPDGRRIIISATEPGHGSRLYVQDIDGGDPRAFTGDGVRLMSFLTRLVSPDGQSVIALGPDQVPAIYRVAGGAPQPIPALGSDLTPIGWAGTSQQIYARARALGRVSPVFKVDLATNRREPWREVGPADLTGSPMVVTVQVSPDGRRYAYATTRWMADLYLIEIVQP